MRYQSGRAIELDIYVPGRRLIIEYNGKQHYEPVAYFGGKDKLKYQQQRDAERRQAAAAAGLILVEYPYWRPITEEEVRKSLAESGIDLDR